MNESSTNGDRSIDNETKWEVRTFCECKSWKSVNPEVGQLYGVGELV